MKQQVVMYADGACSGNPGRGGYCAILTYKDKERVIEGYAEKTTNNRMELTAVIEGINAICSEFDIKVVTDSKYVVDGMNKYLPNWQHNGWRTKAGKAVKNQDLWGRLHKATLPHQHVEFEWTKGHSNNEYNERCNDIAQKQAGSYQK
jgi:ribonuclease HI